MSNFSLPRGFRTAALHCGIKSNPESRDLALFVSDLPCAAAGVYTTNLVRAAPVQIDEARTPSAVIRAVIANSGNANACTGEEGLSNARSMLDHTAHAVDIDPTAVLVLSTGIIGEQLPMNQILTGIDRVAAQLGDTPEHLEAAARGIMTTDTVPKIATRTFDIEGTAVTVTGVAKGAAMIGPKMATMLAVIMTDAHLEPHIAAEILIHAVDDSFNCISVDGHTSTNDTVLFLANGAVGGPPLAGAPREALAVQTAGVCQQLARAIPADGEGASHLVTIHVRGTHTAADARRIAKSVADSPLVKTAIAGADPNWGRIVSAAGYAGVALDPAEISLCVNQMLLYASGAPVAFVEADAQRSIRDHHETLIELEVGTGPASARFWTCDLTSEYIRLNAEYHT